jgi:hypothetical protein
VRLEHREIQEREKEENIKDLRSKVKKAILKFSVVQTKGHTKKKSAQTNQMTYLHAVPEKHQAHAEE